MRLLPTLSLSAGIQNFQILKMQVPANVPFAQRLDLSQIVGHDCDNESYNRVPISSFGLNMLKSMGWQEGKGIGKNPQFALVKPIVYIPNYERAGLGAHKMLAPSLKKRRRLSKATEADAHGRTKNYLEIGGERPKKVEKNAKVRITSGKYEGLKGVVVDMNEGKKECFVELEINEDLVKVDLSKVKLLEARYDQEHMESDIEEKFIRGRGNDDTVSNSEEGSLFRDGSVNRKKRAERKSKKVETSEKRRLKWISAHIWVRVTSKQVRDGRLYERRVYITDVFDEYNFSAIDEKGNVVDDLREKDVETVLPKVNGLVKVLVGEHKDKIAVLLERDRKRNSVQVQFVDTLEIENYTQDDCSMYEEKM